MAPRIVFTSSLLFCVLVLHCFAGVPEDNVDCSTDMTLVAYACCNFQVVLKDWFKPQRKCRTQRTDCGYMTCLFEQGGWIESEEKVNLTTVSKYLTDSTNNLTEWKDSVKQVTNECLSQHSKPKGTERFCESMYISKCIIYSLFKNCPLFARKDDCEQLTSFLQLCDL